MAFFQGEEKAGGEVAIAIHGKIHGETYFVRVDFSNPLHILDFDFVRQDEFRHIDFLPSGLRPQDVVKAGQKSTKVILFPTLPGCDTRVNSICQS